MAAFDACVRLRESTIDAEAVCCTRVGQDVVQVEHPDTHQVERFTFKDVRDQSCNFRAISEALEPAVNQKDQHLLAISYGKGGSGKTFALFDEEGVIYGALRRILEKKAENDKLECVALEIYGEQVTDLLLLSGEETGARMKKATSLKSLASGTNASDSTRVSIAAVEDFDVILDCIRFSRVTNPVKSYRPHLLLHLALQDGANTFTFMDYGCRSDAAQKAFDQRTTSYETVYEGLGATILPLQTCALLKRVLPYPTKTIFVVNLSPSKTSYEETVDSLRVTKHLAERLQRAHSNVAGLKSQLQKRLASIVACSELKASLEKQLSGLGLSLWNKEITQPTLRVLHPDSNVSGILAYALPDGATLFGSEKAGAGRVTLLGNDVLATHGELHWNATKNELSLKSYKDAKIVMEERVVGEGSAMDLSHGDTLLIGSYVCCQVCLPQESSMKRMKSWHGCINQQSLKEVEDVEKCVEALMNKASTESKIMAEEKRQGSSFYLRKLRIQHRKDMLLRQLALVKYLVNVVNQYCDECSLDVRYQIARREYCYANQTRTHSIMVKIVNLYDDAVLCFMSLKAFHDRYAKVIQAKESEARAKLIYDSDKDSELLLGESTLYLEPLSYLLHVEEEIPIFNFKGDVKGMLSVFMKVIKIGHEVCKTKDDTLNTPRDAMNANPTETIGSHLGKELELCVEIRQAAGLPSNLKWIRVKCMLGFGDILHNIESNKVDEDVVRAQINSKQTIRLMVTEDLVSWFESDAVEFQVWCHPISSDSATYSGIHAGNPSEAKADVASVKALEAQNKKLEAEVRKLNNTIAQNQNGKPKHEGSKSCQLL